jgi:hypothetical protein
MKNVIAYLTNLRISLLISAACFAVLLPLQANAQLVNASVVGQYNGTVGISLALITVNISANGAISGSTTNGCQFSGNLALEVLYLDASEWEYTGLVNISGCDTINNASVTVLEIHDNSPYIMISGFTSSGQYSSLTAILQKISGSPPPSATDYTGAWSASSENGVGLSIIRGSTGSMGVIWYAYDPGRIPAWYILLNATLANNILTGQLYRFTGPAYNETWNQAIVQNSPVGTASLTFNSATSLTFAYTVNGFSATKFFSKLNF